MTDAALTPTPPAPGGGAPPAGGDAPPPALKRPDWLPEQHWDTQANAIKPEFGTHYAEIATFHKTESERQAALKARKPEDIPVALPADFKLPENSPVKLDQIKINDKDPRVPLVRAFALKHGLPSEAIGELVALDAQMQIEAYTAETTRLAEENRKLGDKAEDRVKAVATWATGLKERGEIADAELAAIHEIATTAAGVTLFEKLIGKVNGSIPGHTPEKPSAPQPKSLAERMWPQGFDPNPQQKKAS